MKRYLRAAQVLTAAAIALMIVSSSSASAATLKVETTAKDNTIRLGQATSLRTKLSGLTQAERNAGTLVFQMAKFPYRTYRAIGKIPGPAKRERLTVSPEGNTRIQVSFVSGNNIRLISRPVTLYVNPLERGGGWNNSRRGTRFRPFLQTYSRSFLGPWRSIPKRMRTVYLYQRCAGTSFYRLLDTKQVRTIVGKDRIRLNFPSATYTFKACGGKGFIPIYGAMSKFPGYLRNGDDGGGKPFLNARLYKRWVKWAGRDRIPARVIEPVFIG